MKMKSLSFALRKRSEKLLADDEKKSRKKHFGFIAPISRYALTYNLTVIAYYIVRLYFLTIRIESINEEIVARHLQKGGKLIAALWHQRIISVIRYAKGFGVYRPAVMISASRDGDLIASIFSRMNFRPVRGSSSLNGKKALLAMLEDLTKNNFAVHIPDGPQGPQGVVKAGLIVLAKESGAPIIPVYASVSRAWILRSWDRCLIPKPFSKIIIRWDQPISVPAQLDEQSFEEIKTGLEKHMLENQRQDDSRFGWKNLI
jgi:lysophospholipid acyltransferase (LPLAT)-like uncharacterized protein